LADGQQRKSHTFTPETIEIHTESSRDPAGKWYYAELSYNPTSNANVISKKLATSVLKKPIYQLKKEDMEWITRNNGCDELGEGYVDLTWCFERSPRRIYGPIRFIVSATYDPPYDAVLGRRDTINCGIMRARDCG